MGLFHQNGNRYDIRHASLDLGRQSPQLEDVPALLGELRNRLPSRLRQRVAAVSIHRLCMNTRHEHPPVQASESVRLERVGAYVLTGRYHRLVENVTTPVPYYDPPDYVGRLRLGIDFTGDLEPAIFLPATPAERHTKPVIGALEIGLPDGAVHVAIRGLERLVFED
jgi:hypothetical protein